MGDVDSVPSGIASAIEADFPHLNRFITGDQAVEPTTVVGALHGLPALTALATGFGRCEGLAVDGWEEQGAVDGAEDFHVISSMFRVYWRGLGRDWRSGVGR